MSLQSQNSRNKRKTPKKVRISVPKTRPKKPKPRTKRQKQMYVPPLRKYSLEQLGLSNRIDLTLHYAKNVLVFFLLIFGNQYLTGNLLVVLQIQVMYTLHMFFSLLQIKSSNIGFVFQEVFYNFYLMCLLYYYYNVSDARESLVLVLYFFGLSCAVFFVFFELVFVFVIRPLRQVIGRPVPE